MTSIKSRHPLNHEDTAPLRRGNSASAPWNPLVTIVTPVLNRASILASCLSSVAAQTYPHVEHIVVDGGSTDGTLDVLKSFSASHPLRWVTGRDDGMYDAINKGLSLATGEVFAYLNSDDLYLPWSVEAAVERLNEGAELVYGDLGVLAMKGPRSRFFVQFYPPFDLGYYTHVSSIAQPTVFWRRSVTEQIGRFDTNYPLIADCEYWLRAATSGLKLSHVDEILAVQIEHGDTLRATHGPRYPEEYRRMRAQYADFAAPPRLPQLEPYRKSLRWRVGQWRFLLACARRDPKMWPRFISFLRRYGIRINRFGSLVLFSLPRKARPSGARWVDTSMFGKAILEEIGVSDPELLVRPLPKK